MKERLAGYMRKRYGGYRQSPKRLRRLFILLAMFRIHISQTQLLVKTPLFAFVWLEEQQSPVMDVFESGLEFLLFPSSWTLDMPEGQLLYRHHWREIWMVRMERWRA